MSEDTKTATSREDVKATFLALRDVKERKAEYEQYFQELRTESGISARERVLLETIQEAETQLEKLQDEFKQLVEATDPGAVAEYDEARVAYDAAINRVKEVVRSLPTATFRQTQRYEEEGLGKLTVAKGRVFTEYDMRILEEMPGLSDMEIDGDPIVVKSLNSAGIQRLVAQGVIPADLAERYGTEALERTPAVKLTLDD